MLIQTDGKALPENFSGRINCERAIIAAGKLINLITSLPGTEDQEKWTKADFEQNKTLQIKALADLISSMDPVDRSRITFPPLLEKLIQLFNEKYEDTPE